MDRLSPTSVQRMAQVHPALQTLVIAAAPLSTQDFAVLEGVRSRTSQYDDWKRHASKLNGTPLGSLTPEGDHGTGTGKHQLQQDGTGHAVDIVPLVRNTYRWEWTLIYPIAKAIRQAAISQGTTIRWGGVWDRHLNDLPEDSLPQAVADYIARHQGPDFLDGPHYEIVL